MPVQYEFSGNLLHMSLIDSYTVQEIMETYLAALKDPLFPEGARFLFDVRQSAVLSERSAEEIKAVAHFFARHSERLGRRCAIVASDPVHYGLSRMGATFAEFLGADVKVFSNIDDAVTWLDSISVK